MCLYLTLSFVPSCGLLSCGLLSCAKMMWYFDRSVVAGAFHATELFWITDKTANQGETWRFLTRGLRDAENLRLGASGARFQAATVADAAMATLATLVRASRSAY
jgi:hypothetical protein